MKTSIRLALFAALAASALLAQAQQVVRGPYLQLSTENSVVVKWRTDIATESMVRFGTVQGALNSQQMAAGTRTDHEVTVSGLAADTRYFYAVGSANATLAGNDANHFFRTHPVQGTAKALRVWVLGDAGRGNADQRAVRDAYLNFTGTRGTDLTLLLGDNAYEDGTDAEYQAKHFAIYPMVTRNTVMWSTRGNHERDATAYFNIFAMPRNAEAGGVASGTEAYHSFNVGNVHFVNLDSYGSSRSATGAMATWLKNDLAANTLPWVIAFWHHPPYTKGSHDSDSEIELVEMRQNIVPILEQHGVDLVLGGHSHSYERSFLLDGHYGTSSTLSAAMKKNGGSGREDGTGAYTKPAGMVGRQGAVYAVPGSSGTISGGSLNHPAMFISLNRLGSMVLDIDGGRLQAKFLRENGVIDDYFTLVKDGTANTPPNVAISAPAGGASFSAPANITLNANATDSDGTIARVEFFNGASLIGTDTTAPYSVPWNNVPAGSYSLTARATDDKGANRTSAAVNVTVAAAANAAPTVSLTAPGNGSSYTAPASIALSASAADSDGSVARVEFFNGGTLIGSDTTAPYSVTWSNVGAGTYNLSARATDNAGASTTSSSVAVTVTGSTAVNVAPTVSVTSPANGAVFTAPAHVNVAVNAADSDGSIARVELLQGSTVLATDVSAPYSFALSVPTAGTFTFTVRATDNLGATGSANFSVTVNAAVPSGTRFKVNSVLDNKNNKTHGAGSDVLNDVDSATDVLYKLEVEPGSSSFWWDIHFADPAGTAGAPLRTVVTLHLVPEESWTGVFTLQYLEGSIVRAQVSLPLDSSKDNATGKGRKTVYTWDLTGAVPGLATLSAGRVRVLNTPGNGKKVFVTYAVQDVQF
jgi:acid phosphatase type 7